MMEENQEDQEKVMSAGNTGTIHVSLHCTRVPILNTVPYHALKKLKFTMHHVHAVGWFTSA